MDLSPPDGRNADRPGITVAVRREAARLCRAMGWAVLHEVALPHGRRADILALRPDGDFVCVEVKSGVADFVADTKWQDYRDYCDALYFAVDAAFPLEMLPGDVGVIVTAAREAALWRVAPVHRMAGARRRALLMRFALLAACRLENLRDPLDGFALACE
jgi:hypothetical protein